MSGFARRVDTGGRAARLAGARRHPHGFPGPRCRAPRGRMAAWGVDGGPGGTAGDRGALSLFLPALVHLSGGGRWDPLTSPMPRRWRWPVSSWVAYCWSRRERGTRGCEPWNRRCVPGPVGLLSRLDRGSRFPGPAAPVTRRGGGWGARGPVSSGGLHTGQAETTRCRQTRPPNRHHMDGRWNTATGKLNTYIIVQFAPEPEKREVFLFLLSYFGYTMLKDGGIRKGEK
jgi:hypothetical protein